MMWKKFLSSFHHSATIVFARIQLVLGAVLVVVTATDMSPFIHNPKYLTIWLIFSGIVTELARRRRLPCEDETKEPEEHA